MRIQGNPINNYLGSKWLRRPVLARTALALIICAAGLLTTASINSQTTQPGGFAAIAQQGNQERDINAMFYKYESLELNLEEAARDARTVGRVALQLKGVKYDLELEQNNLLAPGYRAVITTDNGEVEEAPAEVDTYRGRVAGDDESDVRLLIRNEMMSGYIRAKKEWLFIDPLSKYNRGARPGQLVVYRDADVRPEARGTCGSEEIERKAEKLLKAAPSAVANAIISNSRVLEIVTDADFEFFGIFGTNSNTVIRGILNQVDGIYQSELDIAFVVTFQNVWATANDPYTSSQSGTLLDQLEDEWNNNRRGVQRDLAHLFSGKLLEKSGSGRVVGRANIGAVCSDPDEAYSLSSVGLAKVVAHEIGHNFDAVHDSSSLCDDSGPLMCASVQSSGTNTFSQRSKNDILDHLSDHGGCLSYGSAWAGVSNGSNQFAGAQWASVATSPSMKTLTGDFNGDGLEDVLKIDTSNYCNGGLWVGLSDGAQFNFSLWDTWCTPASIKVLTGDFNGDGKTDVMKFDQSNNCAGGLWVGLSNGVNGFNTSQWGTWCTPADIKVFAGDFNGDGKTDVMKIDRSDNCAGGLWVGLSTGNWFNGSLWATWCTPASIKVLTGDFNGDGRTDVMKFDQSDNCSGGLWVGLSNGVNAFNSSSGPWATWCTPASIKVFAGDFNGDGKTDVMKFDQSNNCGGGLWVGLSNGANAFNSTPGPWATWCTPASIRTLAGDFNGDHRTDVMKFDVP